MTITWRNAGPWGPATVATALSSIQVDYNFWDHEQRVRSLEAGGRQVADVTQSGNAITFLMTDYTTEGPFTLGTPVINWTTPVTWQPSHTYLIGDGFVQGSTAYSVLLGHTSSTLFDANANDGHGHNYYKAIFVLPGGLPPAGSTGQIPMKATDADFDIQWRSAAMPVGGVQRQVVMKNSTASFDGSWHYPVEMHLRIVDMFDFVESPPLQDGDVVRWVSTGSGIGFWENSQISAIIGNVTLDTLSDVTITTPAAGEVLKYDGAQWVNNQLAFTDLATNPTATPYQVRQQVQTALVTSTPATLMTIYGDIFTLTPTQDMQINAQSSGAAGGHIVLVITTTGLTSRTITFGTHFKSTGTLATGTVNAKVFTVCFIDNGTDLIEVARTTAM